MRAGLVRVAELAQHAGVSSPSEQFQEAHERHEAAGERGPRWVPLAAAILAVLAALSGFVSNLRSTAALVAKNDAIIATTRASDTYAQYQAGRIKFYVYQAAIDARHRARSGQADARPRRSRSARGRRCSKRPKRTSSEAEHLNAQSERLLRSHEIIEIATTLFEVSIVLVSITALVGSRLLLPVVAGIASALGLVIFAVGVFR